MQPLALRPPQYPMGDWILNHERCALWAGMGIGKSSATLFTFEAMRLFGTIANAPTLVIGPMRVARDTWPEEARKWSQFSHLEIVPLVGSPKRRLELLKLDRPYFTISYDLLPWLVEHWLARWPYRQVVADESDHLKGFREKSKGTGLASKKSGASGKRAHQIGRVAHNLVQRWVNLTGTPTPNGLLDLWGQTWFLDRGERLGRTYTAYKERWFKPKWGGYGIEPMPHAFDQITGALRDICLTVDPKDYFDLKEPIVQTVKVTLPPAARKLYETLRKELFAEISEGVNIDAPSAQALLNKCMQLCNGAVYTDREGNWSHVHDAKIEALESIAAESGGTPILVAYQFKSDRARLLTLRGAVDIATPGGFDDFKAGRARFGIAHPRSMGHGVDGLQNASNILVRFGHNHDYGRRAQMLERIGPMRQHQAGFDRPVYVYDLVAANTIESAVISSNTHKGGLQGAVLEAMKRGEA